MFLKLSIFLLWVAYLHAQLEIQIEGKEGWARNLPCWRANVFFEKLLGGKPLTGYHCYMMLMALSVFHGFFLFRPWSGQLEAFIMGLFCFYFVAEDFLWFIFNKHYRLANFCKGKISWHKRWIWFMPLSYWIGIILGILLVWLGGNNVL